MEKVSLQFEWEEVSPNCDVSISESDTCRTQLRLKLKSLLLLTQMLATLPFKFFSFQSNQTDHTIAILWFIWQTQKLIKQKLQ